MTVEQAVQLLVEAGYGEDQALALVQAFPVDTDEFGVPTGRVDETELQNLIGDQSRRGRSPTRERDPLPVLAPGAEPARSTPWLSMIAKMSSLSTPSVVWVEK